MSAEKIGFDNLKSNYLLIKLFFNVMKKTKSLTIVKYSKKLQKRMNLNINSYKDYSQLYSLIELELKLIDDKCDEVERKYNIWFKEKNNTFINILDEEKEYYHIYFDNSKDEIKRNFLNKNEKVNTIKIIIDYQVESLKKLFFIVITLVPLILRNLIALI